jgi:two-component sensor histidine kinase
MNKLILVSGLLLAMAPAWGQRIFRPQFDSMARCIDPAKKDTQQLFTLLRMAEFHIGMTGEFKWDLDSARECIGRARAVNAVVRSRVADGYILLVESLLSREEHGNTAASKKANQQAVEILQGCHNPLFLGKAWMALSAYEDYRNEAELPVKIRLLEKALPCLDQAGAIHLQGDCFEQLADLYMNQGNYRKAEEYGLMAIARFQLIGYRNLQGPCIILANAYSSEFDYASAVKYALLAQSALRDTHDSTPQFCQVYNIIGLLFVRMEEADKSIPYYEAALGWARMHNDLSNLYVVEDNLEGAYLRCNQARKAVALAESVGKAYHIPKDTSQALLFFKNYVLAYSHDLQFDKAKIWCDRMWKMSSGRFDDRFVIVFTTLRYYYLSHQYDAASALIPEFRGLMKQVTDSNYLSGCYRWLFKLDTGRHQYAEAVQDLLNSDRLKDSLFNITKTRQIERLQLDYATAEKESSIKLLQKEAEIQKKDIAHSNQTRNYSIAGAAFLIVAGFGRYRLKQRQNRQLEERQREISAKNEQLEKLLRENEWLLREVHHRVKNNLQIVTSLLGSQSARLRDEAASNAVLESQHRIESMALIHQKLYKSDNVSAVDMEDYVGDMVEYLRDSVKQGQAIVFDAGVEPITLDVGQAVPLGLILNEVITNSIKYAFPGGAAGRISVVFSRRPGGLLCLRISDDGVGLPDDLDPLCSAGFGMRLIRGLAEDLEAVVEVVKGGGTTWVFTFRQLQTEVPG